MELARECVAGSKLTVRHTWKNIGVGRLPEAHPLAFYLAGKDSMERVMLDESFDQTAWFDGEAHTFTHAIPIRGETAPGAYS